MKSCGGHVILEGARVSYLSLLYFKRRPHTHFDSHKHPARTEGIINFALQVQRPHHGGQGCLALEEPGDVRPPGHPLAWLFLVLTTLANAWEPGGGAAEAGAEATSRRGGGGGRQAAIEAGSAGRSAPGPRRDGGSAGPPGGGGAGGSGNGSPAVGALRPGRTALAAAEAPRRPEAAPRPGIRSPQRLLGSAGDAAGGKGRRWGGHPAQQGASVAFRLLGQRPASSFPGVPWRVFFFPFRAPESCRATPVIPDSDCVSLSNACF